jgi:hypothetical protein
MGSGESVSVGIKFFTCVELCANSTSELDVSGMELSKAVGVWLQAARMNNPSDRNKWLENFMKVKIYTQFFNLELKLMACHLSQVLYVQFNYLEIDYSDSQLSEVQIIF